jgi:hypothetical protein
MKKIFISYSHKDENYKDQFVIHLSGLKRLNFVEIWDDRQVKIGDIWNEEIINNLYDSDIIIFLISPDFLASEYINEIEIQKTMKRHDKGEVRIIPIFIRPCDFESSILSKFQGVPRDKKFVSDGNPDSAFLQIINELKKILTDFKPVISLEKPIETEHNYENPSVMIPCDTPPDITKWVGREDELKILKSNDFKAIFITGFGGQGKSCLATKYVYDQDEQEVYGSWDWRDFKEENNRLKTKISEIIIRYTKKDTPPFDLKDATYDELIELLFNTIGGKRILFVFDNIDSYIDYEKFVPLEGFRQLISNVLTRKHNSKFIFTCRPFIKQADVGFYQIDLKGLRFENTIALLDQYNIPIKADKKIKLYEQLHTLTNGHPLWLNLLGAQAVRGIDKLENFIENISTNTDFDELNISKILSDKIIGVLWDSLNQKQKKLLRCLSELVRAEDTQTIIKMIENELNFNQFNKSLISLKLLNLIVTKSGKIEEIELHPLVKSFVKSKYPPNERNKYITIIIDYYDKVTYVLKERMSGNESLNFYENWTNKVELALHKNDFGKALSALEEISSSILIAGYFEEYIRITKLIFDKIDFEKHITDETPYFISQLCIIIKITSETSEFEIARKYLDKFKNVLKDKGKNFIIYCELECNYYWSKSEYNDAISWGDKGLVLQKNSKVDTTDLEHILNLSKRDSRIVKYIEESLVYFLKGNNITEIINQKNEVDLPAHFFGNVGRCYYLLNKYKIAEACYTISFQLCYEEEHSNKYLNRGFISYWLGQVLQKQGNNKIAYFFFSNCIFYWSKHSPHRAKRVEEELNLLKREIPDIEDILKLDSETIENQCKLYCEKQLHHYD